MRERTSKPLKRKPEGDIVGVYCRWDAQHIVALPNPNRHYHCIVQGAKLLGYGRLIGDGHIDQGFYTENAVLLDRYQAYEYAKINGQKWRIHPSSGCSGRILFSEDMW